MVDWDVNLKLEQYVESMWGRAILEAALLRCDQRDVIQDADMVFSRQGRANLTWHSIVNPAMPSSRRMIFVAAELAGETAHSALQGFGLYYLGW